MVDSLVSMTTPRMAVPTVDDSSEHHLHTGMVDHILVLPRSRTIGAQREGSYQLSRLVERSEPDWW
jgi:hypothetical protein